MSCNGIWGNCVNAVHTLDKGWPVMRCKLTGKHPDECRPVGNADAPESPSPSSPQVYP
jgi:hypothetical protein